MRTKVLGMIAVLAMVFAGTVSVGASGNAGPDIVEQSVSFQSEGGTVYGTLVMPDPIRGKVPAVLLLHGFTGTRDELPIIETDGSISETFYSRTARLFAENGIATLRIDFRGSGESIDQFTFEGTTFSGQVADALAAVEYLDDLREVQDIGIVGLSQGGLVGSVTAAADRRVDSLVLWSPVANPVDTYKTVLGEANVLDGLHQPTTQITLPWGAVIELNQPFFEELYEVDPVAAIAGYGGPMLVVVGSRDDIVTPQPYYGEVYIAYHNGPENLVVVDGDHVFDVLAGNGAPALGLAIDESLDWFGDTLHW